MNRDDIPSIRAANPVLRATGYPEPEIAERVADIVRSDGNPTASLAATHTTRPHRAPRFLVPAVASALVVIVAVVAAIVLNRGSSPNDAGGTSPVSCAVSTAGGSKAISTREKTAAQVVRQRIETLGGTASAFDSDTSDGTVGFTPHGVSVATATQACHSSTTAIRTLVTAPVRAVKNAPRKPDPLSALGFVIPTSEAALARLTSAQRTQLVTAMSHYDCSGKPAAGDARLLCSDPAGDTQVYLLAAAIVGGTDVASAAATAPHDGQIQWTVDLTLRTAAGARLGRFTARHHTDATNVSQGSCGASSTVSCEDFLALVTNDVVNSAPLTSATISSPIQITGALSKATAQALAADYSAASIGLRPA